MHYVHGNVNLLRGELEMRKKYSVALEISGPTAMWTRPDTGDSPVSYPAPTYSAVKGIFESILWIQAVEVIPIQIEICAPIVYHSYNTNYGGPLRKGVVIQSGGSFQLLASALINPCYRLHAEIRRNPKTNGAISERTRAWQSKTTSPEHAYQEIFNRRLKRGQSFSIPFLGWKEFVPDYVGPFRQTSQVMRDINLQIPSMLRQVFPSGLHSELQYVYDNDVEITEGVLTFKEVVDVE
jgi:CRISPR-associated protein Cas5d